jgi:hypothetical protein
LNVMKNVLYAWGPEQSSAFRRNGPVDFKNVFLSRLLDSARQSAHEHRFLTC